MSVQLKHINISV